MSNNNESKKQDNQAERRKRAEQEFSPLRTLSRLLVGGMLEGADELIRRLQQWEAANRSLAEGKGEPVAEDGEDKEIEYLRYALIGMLFESQTRMRNRVERLSRRTNSFLSKVLAPAAENPYLKFMHFRVKQLLWDEESPIERWIEIGRREEIRSRTMARQAIIGSVDEFIAHLSHNPELQEVVQQQSVGLASELIDEVRERTVTVDTLVERFARSFFRLPPREELLSAEDTIKSQNNHHDAGH
jgi:hypothetical protein